ncbi:MAG: catalase [Firmicutes bacterium]|nr:catalase [Bacillota bacterium]
MNQLEKIKGHLKTINKHKIEVTKLCFRCHLYKQGLLHDLSKYSYCELKTGFKYYQGYRSPIDAQKEDIGYSLSWLHHKGRNKHHWEYWLDNSMNGVVAIEMPVNYVIEMFCDRVAASMIYQKDKYTDSSALEYYEKGRNKILIHPNTDKLIHHLLTYLSEHGLDATIDYIIKEIKE